jgi:hypothetical protein
VAKVLNAILTHQPPECVARMLDWWRGCVPLDGVLIVAGGTRADFEGIAHAQKIHVTDARLHTRDHQREFQSYTGVYSTIAQWLVDRDFTHVLFCECDHLPLVSDFNTRHLDRLAAEDADVIGCQLRRVDGTSDPHYLHHRTLPGFHEHWEKLTCRDEGHVILSMFGSGSLWTRAAFEAVAACTEPFPIYLELYLPSLAHHLGYRLRDLPDQNPYVRVLPVLDDLVEKVRAAGAWGAHPVKRLWSAPR